jgi:hypothetical protein
MALDRLESVEKFPITIGGENTRLSIIVSVLSVGIPTTSNVLRQQPLLRVLLPVLFLSYLSHLVNEGL